MTDALDQQDSDHRSPDHQGSDHQGSDQHGSDQHGSDQQGPDYFGSTVRAWRERLQPAAVGLPSNGPRRTPGMRREEVAALAGLSVDYLVRLEQGRATRPSPQVLASMARTLRLTSDERDHLYRLGHQEPPRPSSVPTHVPPGVQRMIERLSDGAVAVYDASWSVITWNATWAALMGDLSGVDGRDRNLLWRHFAGARSRVVRPQAETEEFERSAVADLRVASGRYPDDESLRSLISDLRRVSERFAALWDGAEAGTHRTDRKTIRHPQVGDVTFDCDVLTVAGSDLRIVVYTAEPGSADAEKLDLIRVLGLQRI